MDKELLNKVKFEIPHKIREVINNQIELEVDPPITNFVDNKYWFSRTYDLFTNIKGMVNEYLYER